MKKLLTLIVGFTLLFVLAACGEKSQEDVLTDLETKMEEISGYTAEAQMTLNTGQDPQVYNIDIAHKKPMYYRIHLKNQNEEKNSQMILRNDEGVFVLTPALNKSFRFQSDWPENSSQAYLYESLIQDILMDKEAKFEATADNYVFTTKTNYQNNKNLPVQEITLAKKTLAPVTVKVMDQDMNTLVEVAFANVEFDPTFEDNAFEVEHNMTTAQVDIPVMAQPSDNKFEVLYPTYEGVELVSTEEVTFEDSKRVIMQFGGQKPFTLIQEEETVSPVVQSVPINGKPVDLGFTIAAQTNHSIEWTYEGVNFFLASDQLTQEEMIAIARTVQGKAVK